MPNALIDKVVDVTELPRERVEHLWKKAKKIAKDAGKVFDEKDATQNREFYSYVVGIFKQMLGKGSVKELKWKFPERWTQAKASSDSEVSWPISYRGLSSSSDEDKWLKGVDVFCVGYSGVSSSDANDPYELAATGWMLGSDLNPHKQTPRLVTANDMDFISTSFGITKDVIDLADTDVVKSKQVKVAELSSEPTVIDAGFWLPLAASHYHISPNLKDYLLIPVPALISSIPNSNGDSVSKQELLAFSPNLGIPAFKSWKGKGTFLEHDNKDITRAKGVILDVYLRPLRGFAGGRHAKVIELLAFDKTKDKELCRKLEAGDINTFSVGIYYSSFSCSTCGNTVSPSAGQPCNHTRHKMRTYLDSQSGQLVYRHCHNIVGFETSCVADPAYVCAIGEILR
jgi:hypothetical protein